MVITLLPNAARAADAQGCVDLKLFPRLQGCAIVECAAKQHDAFDTGDGSGSPLDLNTSSLAYSCPAWDLKRIKRAFEAQLRAAGYQTVAEDRTDPENPGATAGKGPHWLRWSASSEDGGASYSITSANKLQAGGCAPPPLPATLKQCEIVECNSKTEDSVAMRTAQKRETSLTGNVQTMTLECPAMGAAQAFSAVERELRESGLEILFRDREPLGSGWLTGRSGARWMEFTSAPDGESVSYELTVVSSAEVLAAEIGEPAPVPVAIIATPEAMPLPTVAPAAAPEPAPASPEPAPASPELAPASPRAATPPTPISAPAPAASASYRPAFIYPKPIAKVPIVPGADIVNGIRGEVVVHMLVDVSEEGLVTKAVLAGRITKNALKLESAALEAMSHWRFEPARQDGRIVASVKIPVEIRHNGRPRRF